MIKVFKYSFFFILLFSCGNKTQELKECLIDQDCISSFKCHPEQFVCVECVYNNESYNCPNSLFCDTNNKCYSKEYYIAGAFTEYNNNEAHRIVRLDTKGNISDSFNTGVGADDSILFLDLVDNNDLILGGLFNSFNNFEINGLLRVFNDGSIDSSLVIGTGGVASTIAIQKDNKIILGGNFNSFNGVLRNKIIRLNSNGSVDPYFNIGTGFSSYVTTIAIQSDDKILVGGFFTTYNNVSSSKIARLNFNGSIDDTFLVSDGFDGTYPSVNKILLLEDEKFLVGGYFNKYNNIDIPSGLIKLKKDGTIDSNFNIGSSGFGGHVQTIAIQSDNKILVGGNFNFFNSVSHRFIVRLNSDGSLDPSFNIVQTGPRGFNSDVKVIVVQDDDKILVGGSFTSYNGVNVAKLVRLNTDGSIDTNFNIGSGFNDDIYTILSCKVY